MSKRDRSLRIRLNAEEHALIADHASRIGLSISEVIRDFVKSLAKRKPRKKEQQ